MPHTWVPHNDQKAPVLKNIIYGIKIMFRADKNIIPAAVMEQISVSLFGQFVQGVLFLKVLLTLIEGNGTYRDFVKTLMVFLAVGIANEIVVIVCDYVQLTGHKKVFKSLNNMIFKKASQVDICCYEDPAFYDSYKRASEILTGGYFLAFCWGISYVVASVISFLAVIGVVVSIDPKYLLFLAPVVLVFAVEIYKSKLYYKRDMEMTTNNRIKAYTQRTVFLKDFSKDMRTGNIFGVMMAELEGAVNRNISIIKNYGMRLFFYNLLGSLFGEIIPVVGSYSLASYQFITGNSLTISGFSVVLSSINSVRASTMQIANSLAELSNMALYFQNLREFFEYEPRITDGPLDVPDMESIELRNVSFKYPGAAKCSLRNVNLKINAGETVALVGINGAGKTTLVKLLLRFYDPDRGEILYNGVNIKEYNVEQYRKKFATVFQDYRTFALSVNENVLCHECGDDEAPLARQALEQAGVWEKIQTLPRGADTVLTREFDDNGAGLSGGEAQKTAVARMFARRFDIAILDEPSSALDPIAEYNMYENLVKATQNKTVVYISHRLSSAVLSDKIFVLDGGTVTESGSHQELMDMAGEYCNMFTLQASSYNRGEATENE